MKSLLRSEDLFDLESGAGMADSLAIVKKIAGAYRSSAKSNADQNPSLAERHTREADAVEAIISEVELARKRLTPIPTTYGDISDLPPEVLAELNLTKIDELEQQLRDIVVAADGEIGLDPIIIALYRRHNVTLARRFVMNKLYRMAQKGIIEAVEGRKGVYQVVANVRPAWDDIDLDEDVPF